MEKECRHIDHDGFALPTDHNRKWIRKHNWIAFSIFAVVVVFYSIVPFLLYVPLIMFTVRWYPRPVILFTSWAIGKWLVLTTFVIEVLLGVRVRTFGDTFDHLDDRSLLLMNHRTHLDWLFLWSVLARYGNLDHWKPIMKSSLKHIPVYGWAMQYALHIFVNRNWKDDREELRTKLQFYNTLNLPVQVLLFPGGGDLTLKSKAHSDQYAYKKGLPYYNYVLQPHLRGFLYVLNTLRNHQLDSIVDITVAYPDVLPKTELDFVKGHVPYEVYYYVKCYPMETVPNSDEELSGWLRKVWSEKEERLKYFYSNRQFPKEEQHLEKHCSISGIYQAIVFSVVSNLFCGVMFYNLFYPALIYFIISLGWLSYKVINSNGAIDKLLISEVYSNKRIVVKSFDYQVPVQLVN